MEKTIDGVKFSVAPFHASEALKLKAYLLKKLGPSIGHLAGSLLGSIPESGKAGDAELDGAAMSLAAEKLAEQLGEEEFLALVRRMLRNVTASLVKDGAPLTLNFTEASFESSMDIVFTGRLFTVYPAMLLVLEANYPDFFGRARAGIGRIIRRTPTSGRGGQGSAEGPRS